MKYRESDTPTRREILKTVFFTLAVSAASGISAATAAAQNNDGESRARLDIVNRLSPLNSTRPVRPQTRYIVLHTTEGKETGSLNKLVQYGEAHYFVARAGRIYRIIDKEKIAKHSGRSMWEGLNTIDNHSIGIEVSGYHNQDITAAQYESLKEILRQLKSLYGLSDDKVLTHSMVAYGRPNRFQNENHRGRKRCGMIFADSKVRARLGLKSAPDRDPDVAAGRLKVADKELFNYLFPAGRSGASSLIQSAGAAIPYKPSEPEEPPDAPDVETADATEIADMIEPVAAMESASATEPVAAAEPDAGIETTVAVQTAAAPKTAPAPKTIAASKPAQKPAQPAPQREMPSESQVVSLSRTAWQIARERYNSPSTIYEFPDGRRLSGNQVKDWGRIPAGTRVITGETYDSEQFEGFLEIGKDGDTPQALAGNAYAAATTIYIFPDGLIRTGAELQKQPSYRSLFKNPPKGTRLLVGYVFGGRVTGSRRPSRIAGIKWNYPSTYYRYPDGRILSGDDVKDSAIPTGTLVFFQE